MATPDRMTLIAPLKVWAGLNLIFLVMIACGSYGLYRVSSIENQRLVDSQREILDSAPGSHFVTFRKSSLQK